jgi:hypothetical protein
MRIRREAMESIPGQMVGVIEDNGSTENNMVKEHTLPVLARKSMANGEMAKE